MKQNNKKTSKVRKLRVSGKTTVFAALIFLQAILAYAKEGIVVRQRVNQQANGVETTAIALDTDGDTVADTYILLSYTNAFGLNAELKDLLREGAVVTYEDNAPVIIFSGLPCVSREYITAINGRNILDIFPGAPADFPHAADAARRQHRPR